MASETSKMFKVLNVLIASTGWKTKGTIFAGTPYHANARSARNIGGDDLMAYHRFLLSLYTKLIAMEMSLEPLKRERADSPIHPVKGGP